MGRWTQTSSRGVPIQRCIPTHPCPLHKSVFDTPQPAWGGSLLVGNNDLHCWSHTSTESKKRPGNWFQNLCQKPLRSLLLDNSDLHFLTPGQHRAPGDARTWVARFPETIAFFTIAQQRSALFEARTLVRNHWVLYYWTIAICTCWSQANRRQGEARKWVPALLGFTIGQQRFAHRRAREARSRVPGPLPKAIGLFTIGQQRSACLEPGGQEKRRIRAH